MLFQVCGFAKFPPQRYVIRASTICYLSPPTLLWNAQQSHRLVSDRNEHTLVWCVHTCACARSQALSVCWFVWVEGHGFSLLEGEMMGGWGQRARCLPFADLWLFGQCWGHPPSLFRGPRSHRGSPSHCLPHNPRYLPPGLCSCCSHGQGSPSFLMVQTLYSSRLSSDAFCAMKPSLCPLVLNDLPFLVSEL